MKKTNQKFIPKTEEEFWEWADKEIYQHRNHLSVLIVGSMIYGWHSDKIIDLMMNRYGNYIESLDAKEIARILVKNTYLFPLFLIRLARFNRDKTLLTKAQDMLEWRARQCKN